MTERALPITILEPAGIDPELLDHTLSLRFDLGQFDPRITFTRNSSATYFGSDGLLKTAAANEPRIDYDPVTKACKGFLVEESRTNLLTYSEQFDNAAWVKSQATVTQNAETAPDGTLTADKFLENNANNAHQLWQAGVSFTAGTTYTASFFAKAAERSSIRVLVGSSASGFSKTIDFDLLAGTTSDPTSSSITAVGNGWYRCRVTDTPTVTGLANGIPMTLRNAGASFYQGDGTSGVYIWGAQLEAGTFPTSYIKTEATAATRAADSAVMTGTNFSSWYRQDEGTMVAEINDLRVGSGVTSNAGIFDVRQSAGDATNTRMLRAMSGANGGLSLQISDANGVTYNPADSGGVLTSVDQFGKVGLAYKWGDDAVASEMGLLSANRTLVGAAPLAASVLYIGTLNNGSQFQSTRHIKRLSYYPKRLPNAKLQTLTQ